MKLVIALLFLSTLFSFTQIRAAASDQFAGPIWEEVKDSDGIKVFVGKVDGDPVSTVKTEVVIDAAIESIKELLDDEEGHLEWVPYLLASERLQTVSESETVQYNQFDSPWPAANRDLVYSKTKSINDDGSVTYAMRSEVNPLMPEQDGIVRALLMKSDYTLTALNGSRTRVELVFRVEPRGWVPVWITNVMHRKYPFLVLKRLREQLGVKALR